MLRKKYSVVLEKARGEIIVQARSQAAFAVHAKPGPGAGWGEKGCGWTALATGWVGAEMFLENSGPRGGREAGFLVSGVLEQVF